ncbi:MAG: PleD family two-component system response regulator [Cyclobacteriaceae bacterium]
MKILIAEDDEVLLNLIAHRMRRIPGAKIATAPNGKLAGQIAASMQPDIVITEMIMPLVSGPELIAHLRNELQSDAYILAVSSIEKTHARVEALSVGADDFSSKPLDLDELISRIESSGRVARAS